MSDRDDHDVELEWADLARAVLRLVFWLCAKMLLFPVLFEWAREAWWLQRPLTPLCVGVVLRGMLPAAIGMSVLRRLFAVVRWMTRGRELRLLACVAVAVVVPIGAGYVVKGVHMARVWHQTGVIDWNPVVGVEYSDLELRVAHEWGVERDTPIVRSWIHTEGLHLSWAHWRNGLVHALRAAVAPGLLALCAYCVRGVWRIVRANAVADVTDRRGARARHRARPR